MFINEKIRSLQNPDFFINEKSISLQKKHFNHIDGSGS